MDLHPVTFRSFAVLWSAKIASCRPQLKPLASIAFFVINETLRLNNLKTRTAMNAKISLFVICAKAIIYLLLYNLNGSTFNYKYFKYELQLFLRC